MLPKILFVLINIVTTLFPIACNKNKKTTLWVYEIK